ncbi:MAG: hypothetical protein EB060_01525 [Proteobacteria bacterium]|nr:hypothetical protein [Pseudomonadota bacterium]
MGTNRDRWLTEAGIPPHLWCHVFFERGMPSHYITVENFRIHDHSNPERDVRAQNAQIAPERLRAAELIAAMEGCVVPARLEPLGSKQPIYLEVQPPSAEERVVLIGSLNGILDLKKYTFEAVAISPELGKSLHLFPFSARVVNIGGKINHRVHIGACQVDTMTIGNDSRGDLTISGARIGSLIIGDDRKQDVLLRFGPSIIGCLVIGRGFQGDIEAEGRFDTLFQGLDAAGSIIYQGYNPEYNKVNFYDTNTGDVYPVGDAQDKSAFRDRVLALAEQGDLPSLKELRVYRFDPDVEGHSLLCEVTPEELRYVRERGVETRAAEALADDPLDEAVTEAGRKGGPKAVADEIEDTRLPDRE